MTRSLSTEVWHGASGFGRIARFVLTPLSWLYAAGWECYVALYRWGIKRAKRPHRPVVCVGNLVVGGSGKTPLTLHVADLLRSMGRPVVIGCSGYGSSAAVGAAIAQYPQPVANRELWEELLGAVENGGHTVSFEKVKGHANLLGRASSEAERYNQRCDELAVAACPVL